jgi:hypothetical protein
MYVALSQKSVHAAIAEITTILNEHFFHDTINFPTEQEILEIKVEFNRKYGIPGVIGAIDCTHIAIIAPYDNPPTIEKTQYMNRKGWYSINTQIVRKVSLTFFWYNFNYEYLFIILVYLHQIA